MAAKHRSRSKRKKMTEPFETRLKLTAEQFSLFDRVSSEFQRDVTVAMLNTFPDLSGRLEKFLSMSDNKQMDEMENILSTISQAIPFAEAMGVSLLSSILATHGPFTGNMEITNLMKETNRKAIDKITKVNE